MEPPRPRRTAPVRVLALLAALSALPARADEPPSPSPAERAERTKALRENFLLDVEVKRLLDAQRWAEALPQVRRSHELSERLLGAEDRLTVARAVKLGAVLMELGRLAEALTVLERATALTVTSWGPASPLSAQAQSNLAALYVQLGRIADAEALLVEAVANMEAAFGKDHVLPTASMSNLASVLLEAGRPREALAWHRRVLDVLERHQHPNDSTLPVAMVNVAMAHHALGEYGAALAMLERARVVAHERVGDAAPLMTAVMSNLGVVHSALGHYEEAQALARQALQARERDVESTASPGLELRNLGSLLVEMGDLDGGRRALERALKAHETVLGPRHPDTADCLQSLAVVLGALGQREAALALAQRSLEIFTATLGPNHVRTARAVAAVAVERYLAGDVAASLPLFQQAAEATEAALGPDHIDMAKRLQDRASALSELGRADEARRDFERALRIQEAVLGADHPDLDALLNNYALFLQRQGDLDGAERHYRRALALTEAAFGADHPQMITRIHNLAMLAVVRRDAATARRHFERTLDALERRLRRELLTLHGPGRLALARDVRENFQVYENEAPGLGETGYAALLRFKGLVSRLERAEQRLLRAATPEVRARQAELRATQRRLSALASKPPPAGRVEQRLEWRRRYAELSGSLDELTAAFSSTLERAGGARELATVTPAQVRAALPPGSVLIDLLRTDRLYVAWVVGGTAEERRVELGPAAPIEAAAQAFARRASAATSAADPELLRTGALLRSLVLDPLSDALTPQVRTLVISPDGALAAVPFAALPGRAPGTHLIDDHALELVGMAQDLLAAPDAAAAGVGALLIGAVDYAPEVAPAATAPSSGDPPAAVPPAEPPADRGLRWRYLPGTKDEVEALGARVGPGAEVLAGRAATEAALRGRSPGRRLLHVATHGFVRTDVEEALQAHPAERRWLGGLEEARLAAVDPRLLSGLALAGANARRPAGEDDGILTALEAAQLDLAACELVVLSACETALGRVESGEGVIGLVQAFQGAGARDVIASLWRVDDRSTALLMQRLYDGLLRAEGPLPPALALRAAARWLRDEKPEGRDLSAPRHWAAFVAYERR